MSFFSSSFVAWWQWWVSEFPGLSRARIARPLCFRAGANICAVDAAPLHFPAKLTQLQYSPQQTAFFFLRPSILFLRRVLQSSLVTHAPSTPEWIPHLVHGRSKHAPLLTTPLVSGSRATQMKGDRCMPRAPPEASLRSYNNALWDVRTYARGRSIGGPRRHEPGPPSEPAPCAHHFPVSKVVAGRMVWCGGWMSPAAIVCQLTIATHAPGNWADSL